MSPSARHALIAGGGIGGLSAALALVQHGWTVEVHEQAAALTEVGAGLQLSPNASCVLRSLGLLDEIRQLAFAPEAIEMRSGRRGHRIFSIPLGDTAVQRWGAPYLHLHRADLLAVLEQALAQRAPGALRCGSRVTGYRRDGDLPIARCEGGADHAGDLLVGADGLHSAIRAQLHGADTPRYTGNLAWRAVVPIRALGPQAPPPTACIWTGRGRHAVSYRLRGGKLANFVGVVERAQAPAESWSARGDRQAALDDFANFDPVITALIQNAPTLHRWALFDRPPLPRWSDGPVALLGDACHPMLPFLAQGAAQAIEDAWVLARQLSVSRPVAASLVAYQRARLDRTARVQREARANMRRFHRPDAAYLPLRLAAKLRPGLFQARQDWLYGFDVTRQEPWPPG